MIVIYIIHVLKIVVNMRGEISKIIINNVQTKI